MSIDSNLRICKTCIRSILTYTIETRASKHRKLRASQIKTFRTITDVTLRCRMRSERIREECGVQDAVRWARVRRRK